MSDITDVRQDKVYRRGLILGLTIAEVMILLIFVLLMALGAALQNRDKTIEALDQGGASRLIEALQRAYPEAKDQDDYFKELVRAIEVRKQFDDRGAEGVQESLVKDAAIGRDIRIAAERAGQKDPVKFAKDLAADANRSKRGKWPPFVSLSEAGGYYFDSGKATLKPQFEANLKSEIIPMLARNLLDYDVNVIEVIGHTDEVPMSGSSNLDRTLVEASVGRFAIDSLRSTDNAGLAMARAVAVVRVLRTDARLRGAVILPLSGAQMIVPVDRMADGTAVRSDETRRRIEIRLRRTTGEAKPGFVRPVK